MFNPIKSDQNNSAALIQQCLANYDYSNATLLAEELLLKHDSEENKGLLADCYLVQQENHKAYFLLKDSTSPANLYKLAVTCLRLNKLAEAETVLTREQTLGGYRVPNGAYGLQLLATIYKKQNKTQQAREYYEKALKSNPKLLVINKQLEKLDQGFSNNGGVQEAPRSLFENHPGAQQVKNQSVSFGRSVEVEVTDGKSEEKSWNIGTKKEDQSPEEKSYEIIDSPSDEKEEKKEEMIAPTIVNKRTTKGAALVDEYFNEKDCEVYISEEGKVYWKVLNQANLMQNNNKFYIMQMLQSRTNQGTYFLWDRWGRVGSQGQSRKTMLKNPKEAMKKFEQKFYEKTVKGDYQEIEMDFGVYEKEEEEEMIGEAEADKSELPEQVQELMKLIFDEKMMSDQLKTFDYGFRRLLVEKLSQTGIQKAYETLQQLTDAIEKKSSVDVLKELSGKFYSLIPHDFGSEQMSQFVLDNNIKIQQKLEMLASLENIHAAFNLLNQGNGRDNLIDAKYKKLKCGLIPCDKDSDEFKMVLDYLKNTRAPTHSNYNLELLDLFSVEREGEAKRFTNDLHNKQLLWYGSRLTNYAGILSQGLRIPPPEAPMTGYMFGKGVYFSDMVSKSANYCFTGPQNNTGIMLLCEVALGECNEKLHVDYNAANLPSRKHSTKGVGRTAPNANEAKIIDGDVVVPMGKPGFTGVQGGAFFYNEYVVYDVKQIKIRYLLKVKFNY